ncbi:MAG TPA: DUF72 domain-containing protein [Gemmatimonadota bacterium]|nr:DUF72 domain-containing protein [Gemmatimonadota bacterium]
MRLRVGTSGFSYKEWKGPFYPEDLPDQEMLSYYAGRLDAVEINNTFYRMPTRKLLDGWAAQVPDGFRFALKASRKITHQKKLAECADEVTYLADTSATLGERLGPTLVQLPPYLKKDVELLRGFLASAPPDFSVALEFRSSSWFDDEVYDALREFGAALVASDMDEKPEPPVVATAPHGYARLRRVEYDDDALERWAGRFAEAGWEDAYVFFKHEDEATGPRLAERFREIAEGA